MDQAAHLPSTSVPATEEARRPQRAARVALVLALAALGVWTLHGFLPALAWAAVFAVATWPLYQRTLRRTPPATHGMLVPGCFTLGVALLFLVPLGLVAFQVGREARGVLDWVGTMRHSGLPVPDWVSRLPVGGDQLSQWWSQTLSDPEDVEALFHRLNREQLVSLGRSFGAGLLHRSVLFGFTLLTLFFLFRDGERLGQQMLTAGRRAFGPGGERVGRQVIASIHGTVDGLVLVGLGEGLLLGIVYAFAGVPHPALFGALTAVAAMIPFGAPVVFGIAALLLLGAGSVGWAVGVVVAGVVVTFVADHFVRPVLIGGATRLPFVWVLLGILGGVETWGLLGLFLGPAIMAALILLWREWTEHPGPAIAGE